MKNRLLIASLSAAMFVTGACSGTGTAPATNNTANTNTNRATNTANTGNTANMPPANNANNMNAPAGNANNTNTGGGETAGKQDFKLINQTGVEIQNLYVSPHDKDDWQEDVLGRDTLPNGDSVEITFSPKERAAMWDLKVTNEAGATLEWENLNLMEISEVTLRYANGKGTADVK